LRFTRIAPLRIDVATNAFCVTEILASKAYDLPRSHVRMVHRNFLATMVLALALAPLACGGNKPKDKTPDEIEAETKAKEPPPPPKCESLDEKCSAKSDTTAKVKGAALQFKPPEKWMYAQAETYSIAQVSGDPDSAVLVIGSYTPDKDAKKNDAARDAAFADLLKVVGASLPKTYKVAWKKPEAPLEANGLKMGTWVAAGSERTGLKDKKASLMIVHAPVDAAHNLVAVGFVLDEDTKGQEALQTALTTIKPDTGAEEGDKKAEGDKKPEGEKK
jgi:hypothetical protein